MITMGRPPSAAPGTVVLVCSPLTVATSYQRHKAQECPAAARGSEVQGASPGRSPRSNSSQQGTTAVYQGDNSRLTLY